MILSPVFFENGGADDVSATTTTRLAGAAFADVARLYADEASGEPIEAIAEEETGGETENAEATKTMILSTLAFFLHRRADEKSAGDLSKLIGKLPQSKRSTELSEEDLKLALDRLSEFFQSLGGAEKALAKLREALEAEGVASAVFAGENAAIEFRLERNEEGAITLAISNAPDLERVEIEGATADGFPKRASLDVATKAELEKIAERADATKRASAPNQFNRAYASAKSGPEIVSPSRLTEKLVAYAKGGNAEPVSFRVDNGVSGTIGATKTIGEDGAVVLKIAVEDPALKRALGEKLAALVNEASEGDAKKTRVEITLTPNASERLKALVNADEPASGKAATKTTDATLASDKGKASDATAASDKAATKTTDATLASDKATAKTTDATAASDKAATKTTDAKPASDKATAKTTDATAASDKATAKTTDATAASDKAMTKTTDATAASDKAMTKTTDATAASDKAATKTTDATAASDKGKTTDATLASDKGKASDATLASDKAATKTTDATAASDKAATKTTDATAASDKAATKTTDATAASGKAATKTTDATAASGKGKATDAKPASEQTITKAPDSAEERKAEERATTAKGEATEKAAAKETKSRKKVAGVRLKYGDDPTKSKDVVVETAEEKTAEKKATAKSATAERAEKTAAATAATSERAESNAAKRAGGEETTRFAEAATEKSDDARREGGDRGSDDRRQFGEATNRTTSAPKSVKFQAPLSQAPADRAVKQAELIKEISKFIEKRDRNSLTVKVEPESLGKVRITVETIKNALTTRIEVETEAAKQLVERNIHQLTQQAAQSGTPIHSVQVSVGGEGKSYAKQTSEKKRAGESSERNDGGEERVEEEPRMERKLGYNTYEYTA